LVDLRDPVNQRISRIEINQANLQSYLAPSLGNMPESNTGLLQQGLLEQDKPAQVTITEGTKNISDTSGTALDKDES
jgi:hypothetical protein